MLPDLRIVILAVMSTFLFTVGVGFYTSSRLTNEPRTARTDTFAVLEDSPINRIALNWPAPVPVISSINLDFAINAIGSRNPVRDITEDARAVETSRAPAATPPAPVAANDRPAQADAPAMAKAPAEKLETPPPVASAPPPPPAIVATNDPGAIEPSPTPVAPPVIASERSTQPETPAVADAAPKPEELPAQEIAQAPAQPVPSRIPDAAPAAPAAAAEPHGPSTIETSPAQVAAAPSVTPVDSPPATGSIAQAPAQPTTSLIPNTEPPPPAATIETRDPGAIEALPTPAQVAVVPQVTLVDSPPVTGSIAQAPQAGTIDDSTQAAPPSADTPRIAARTDAVVEDDDIPLPEVRPAEADRPAVKRARKKTVRPVKRVKAAPKIAPRIVRRARPRVVPAVNAFNNPAFPFNLFQTVPATPN